MSECPTCGGSGRVRMQDRVTGDLCWVPCPNDAWHFRERGIPNPGADAACKCADEYLECSVHVRCDVNCRALQDPATKEQYAKALVHWREHGYLSGCSHGC